MSTCERCWRLSQSYGDPPAAYSKLLNEQSCTAEEQAGPDAGKCPVCGRMTLHQHTAEPMCGCKVWVKPTEEDIQAVKDSLP